MNRKQKKVLFRIILSVCLFVFIFVLNSIIEFNSLTKPLLFLIPYFIIGYDILIKAFKGIINAQVFDENFLMAIASVGAILLNETIEAVAVMLFYQIGELFQSIAVGKSRKNIAKLMDIRPDYANVLIDGKPQKVSPETIDIGTEIIVNPGEKIAIDGIVIKGDSNLNLSALTGESVPKRVYLGDEVLSGSVNLTGVLHIKTTKAFQESTVSKILDLVENSSMKKSKSENFITKFARYYTPIVCVCAVVLAVIPPVFNIIIGNSSNFSEWITRALTFLVISCPCALVISVPLSFFGGIGSASKNGILIKGSNYLEALSSTKYFVFDKTGTLTKGKFEVVNILTENNFDSDKLLYYVAHAESASNHPIALSIKEYYNQEINSDSIKEIKEYSGLGVRAIIDEDEVLVGNSKLMKTVNIDVEDENFTTVFACVNKKYVGKIIVEDVIKPTTITLTKKLKKLGVIRTIMLTGDNLSIAKKIAKQANLDDFKANLMPNDKVKIVEDVLNNASKGEKVAFVGDGINDAPVLTRADIGIAMGALGSDAAIEAADIVLMDDNPEKIVKAMEISVKTLKIVKQNIAFSILVKVICLILGALGIANMWLAIFADVGVMVLAVFNATKTLKI